MSLNGGLEEGLWPRFNAKNLPELVEFLSLDQDNDLLIFRKFKNMNLSSLLHQQNQLIDLEKKILNTDQQDYEELSRLFQQAAGQLQSYNSALLLQSDMLKLSSPPRHLTDFLLNPSRECPNSLSGYITEDTINDLVALAPTSKGFIHKIIDRTYWLKRPFLKSRVKLQPKGLDIYAEKHVRRFEKALINLAFCVIILVPIYLLARVSSIETKFSIIASAILLAALFVANGLDEYHRVSVTIMVGYTAILVVFLGNTI